MKSKAITSKAIINSSFAARKDNGIIKMIISIIIANLVRLIRFIPNNDPIMAMMLPYAKRERWYVAILFPIITMVTFDIITGFVGIWTIVTAATYGGLAAAFFKYYKGFERISIKRYLGSGVLGVLVFDFITGVLATPLMFGMTFEQSFIGQIPFTLMHLGTVCFFILVITPILDKHILQNKSLEDQKFLSFIGRPRLS